MLNPFKENVEKVPNIQIILMELNITEEECYNALSALCDSDFQIHVKCKPSACFIIIFIIERLSLKIKH